MDVVLLDQVLNLENRHPHFNKLFNFRTTGNDAAIVIAEHCYRFADQIRPENTLTGNVKIVAVNQGDERLHYRG